MGTVTFLDEQATYAAATIGQCADALEVALRDGLPGEPDPARIFVDLPPGELLLMPSRVTGTPTVKLVTIHHDADRPDPRIKGVHVVFDPVSLAPKVIMAAAALTVMRTTAVSIVALRMIAKPDCHTLVVYGAGPQARAHIDAIIAEWPIRHVTIVARRPERAQALLDYARAQHPDIVIDLVGSDGATAALREARIIVCATTATSALFDAADARGDVAAVAVGTHSPTCCELPSELVGRSFVVVEERESALREAGDVVCAITAGFMTADDIAADLTEVAKRSVDVPATGSRVFKSMGMAWEDAVVSARIAEGVA
ncbi:MAG: ornithine cyclodeaminase family protein [Candidatus Nanopelagicales bacterium]